MNLGRNYMIHVFPTVEICESRVYGDDLRVTLSRVAWTCSVAERRNAVVNYLGPTCSLSLYGFNDFFQKGFLSGTFV